MNIQIPADGFCGTHALFLRMLMIFYTREKTLSKLQENHNALMALQANHAIEPYTKSDIIAALEPLIDPFPNLKELIQDSQRDADTQATDIVARAVKYTDTSIAQLTSLQENPNFSNLTRKLHKALGPESTQRDLYTAIHTIILNFTNPSGAQPPHYLPLLRAFMETVVESDLFRDTIKTCKEKIYTTLRPQMPKLLSDIKLHQELYNELFTLAQDPDTGDLTVNDPILVEYTQAMISKRFGIQLEPMYAGSPQGVFYHKAKTFYDDHCETFLQSTLHKHTDDGTTQQDEELDVYCHEVAQALIQRRTNHEHPTVDALLRFNIVQPIVAMQWEDNHTDTPPNIGNLLAIFANTDYTETSCGPSFYTEHTDLILVNELFPLEDVVNVIHGIQLQHVNGNHWNIQIPDSGFLLDTLRSEPTEANYESPGAEATAASTSPPTQPSHTTPHDDDRSPDPDAVALEKRLLQQTVTQVMTTLPPPNFTKANVSASIPLKANKDDVPATEKEKKTLLENFTKISQKIDHLQKKVTKSDQHEDKIMVLAQIESTVTVASEELTSIEIENLTQNDYKRLNQVLIRANKDQGDLKASLSPIQRKPA